jgi:hypothetical protein
MLNNCPFCGRSLDVEDSDTLYPNGRGWIAQEYGPTTILSYHSFREVPKSQWCWDVICNESLGGCGASISGNTREEAIEKWNRRK